MDKQRPDFFTKQTAQHYDERNSKLSRISDCLHFLMSLVLKDLPADSRVLCAGAGTGAEILYLASVFPDWRFVALDPSLAMLDICRERVAAAGYTARCEFVHGYVSDLTRGADFDAVLCMLVAHFVEREDRLSFFRDMTRRLRAGGYLVNAEISFDLGSVEFPAMLKGWEAVQTVMGATPDSLAALPKLMKDVLTVLPPAETEDFMRRSKINTPVRFFQAMMICGWYGTKGA
jgi:tRNA (cmo5U34)-methyltransferase